ncbi:MAG: hypothetical protein F4Y94_04965 [Chloroflexi bacterium]|nr:hypothetical protein [Chloroflexota bacterium]
MESQFAFLCAGVTQEAEAAGGGLTAKGFPIPTILITGTTPEIPPMTLVFGFTYSIDESGLKAIELRLLGPDGTVAAARDMYQFMGPPAGDRRMFNLVLDTLDVTIDEFGEYEFGLHVGYELVATVPFTVVQQD